MLFKSKIGVSAIPAEMSKNEDDDTFPAKFVPVGVL